MLFGLGVGDVGGVFGTTLGLLEKYGDDRVFDIPLSENAVTGMALGLAMQGFRPIMVHQRADFTFVSAEQIINQIAKIEYMSAGAYEVPIVIRMIVGRGWGQGPTHSQSPQAIFSHIPGLRVVMPSSPSDGFHLMMQSIRSNVPVIFIEHRWLHQTSEEISFEEPLENEIQAKILSKGSDLTLISASYGTLEILKIQTVLEALGISVEVINLRSIQPWDKLTVLESVRKTKRALILDTGHLEFGISAEIASVIQFELFKVLTHPVLRIGLPREPTPSSASLAIEHYPSMAGILKLLKLKFGLDFDLNKAIKTFTELHPNKSPYQDQPDVGQVGPF